MTNEYQYYFEKIPDQTLSNVYIFTINFSLFFPSFQTITALIMLFLMLKIFISRKQHTTYTACVMLANILVLCCLHGAVDKTLYAEKGKANSGAFPITVV